MKSYLIEILIIFILTSVTYTGVYMSSHNNLFDIKEMVENKDVKIINFGSSHGGGISYSRLGFDGISFAKAGNTLYYDLQNFNTIKDELDPGTIVLLPVSYFSFGLDENRTCDHNEAFLNDYYEFLSADKIFDYSEETRKEVRSFRLQNNFRNLIPNLLSKTTAPVTKNEDANNLINLDVKRVKEINSRKIKQLKRTARENNTFLPKMHQLRQHARKRVESHKAEGTFIKNANRSYQYLEQIILECKEKGFKPFLVTTPFYSEYNNGFTPEWLYNNYHKYIYKLRDQHKVPYLNYAGDDRIIVHPFLFKNSDHLNQDGKIIFRRYFFSDFKEKYGHLLD